MAYTVRVKEVTPEKLEQFAAALKHIAALRGFSFQHRYNFPRMGSELLLERVRLLEKKPYCGNHPGPCPVSSKPKPKASYLEWDDWVRFHGLVNTLLDLTEWQADVWTFPQDARGKFWVRKENKPRKRYDYTEKWAGMREVRIWNTGTPDQFEEP